MRCTLQCVPYPARTCSSISPFRNDPMIGRAQCKVYLPNTGALLCDLQTLLMMQRGPSARKANAYAHKHTWHGLLSQGFHCLCKQELVAQLLHTKGAEEERLDQVRSLPIGKSIQDRTDAENEGGEPVKSSNIACREVRKECCLPRSILSCWRRQLGKRHLVQVAIKLRVKTLPIFKQHLALVMHP